MLGALSSGSYAAAAANAHLWHLPALTTIHSLADPDLVEDHNVGGGGVIRLAREVLVPGATTLKLPKVHGWVEVGWGRVGGGVL